VDFLQLDFLILFIRSQ